MTSQARIAKKEAEQRGVQKQWRDAAWDHYASQMHSEVADSVDEARQAKAQVQASKHAGARTIKAATGAIERRKTELQARKEAEARALRDRVRASGMVSVPPELAASINASASFRPAGRSSAMRNPDSVLAQPASARGGRRAHGAALEC